MPRWEHDTRRLFSKEYRMLSFVPRWSIAPRLTQQSVAEHCYFVALYASQLCDWLGYDADVSMVIIGWALRHDAPEIWTGDPPGPSKRHFVDEAKLHTYIDRFATYLEDFARYRNLIKMPASSNDPAASVKAEAWLKFQIDAIRIIKVADLVDECMYLRYELALGNTLVKDLFNLSMNRLRAKCMEWGEERAEQLMHCVKTELSRIETEGALIPSLKEEEGA